MKDDNEFIKMAIKKSEESIQRGCFPAGALVVKSGKVLSEEISTKHPDYNHAESKAVDSAFRKSKAPLDGCTLYCSLEPCLMCLTRAYWAGIRRIIFACSKKVVSADYYESDESTAEVLESFNDSIEFVHFKELQEEALSVIRAWEKKRRSD